MGRGVFAPSVRTLFTVGDFKQAIFGFQGTDPLFFRAAETYFAERAEQVRGTDDMLDHERGLPFERLSLTSSFRSTAPILEFVDAAVASGPSGSAPGSRLISRLRCPRAWPPQAD